MKAVCALIVTGIILLGGCASGAPQAAVPEEVDPSVAREAAFLAQVHKGAEAMGTGEEIPEERTVKLGYLICRELEAGRIGEYDTLVYAVNQELSGDAWVTAAGMNNTLLCPDWYKSSK